MGLFSMPKSDSPEDLLNAGIGNLNLYQNHGDDYLLALAIAHLHECSIKLHPPKPPVIVLYNRTPNVPCLYFNNICHRVTHDELLELKNKLDEYFKNENKR